MSSIWRVFTPELERELWQHPNKWVALGTGPNGYTCDRILAVGDDVTQVLEQAERSTTGQQAPVLYNVPDPNVAHYYGMSW